MRTFRRAAAAGALLALFAAPCAAAPDAAALFRRDVPEVERALHWRGQLADETRFAAAASGLSWNPSADGTPLFQKGRKGLAYSEAGTRAEAFSRVRRSDDERTAFAFAFSLLLDPPDRRAWQDAYDFLRPYGADLDRALSGVLLAPDKLPVLPTLRYAAADALVWRASPRTLPLFLTMAGSDDRYLRSRGVAGLGVAAYRSRGRDDDRSSCGVAVELREWSVSAMQERMIAAAVLQASRDSNYRVRAAAALAMGLMGSEDDVRELERLAKDPAYLAFPERGRDTKRILYPVREQAAASLARFGRSVPESGGTFSGKDLKRATRGGRDVTKDRGGVRPELTSQVRFAEAEW